MTEEFSNKLNTIEEKWQEKWNDERIFESDPSEEDKFYITVAYPYPSGGMHIGHVRTFTLPDVFGRFKRMQGKNVLFPMGWHVTGTPIIGALERLKDGEEKQIEVLRDVYNVPEEEMKSWEEPMDYANYFIENSYKPNMKNLGFSVDWRREFTTNDNDYNKFIEWQYKTLREKGLVKKGLHPTKYCLNDQNPVTTHDLLEGEDAEKQEYSLVKFESDDTIFPMATLRPETVFGVTHTLINPEGDYIRADVDGEEWIVSEDAAEKLDHQDREVEEVEKVKGEEFVGEKVRNPVTGEEVLILPASFVDPDSGSGIVMSVPAHAPYDWISLKDIQEDEEKLRKFDLDVDEVQSIEPKTIIDVEDYGKVPAKEVCEGHGVDSQDDEEDLEKATEEIYEKEFHTGTLNSECQDFSGEKVNAIKDRLIEQFENQDRFDSMHDFSEEVVCRCGGKVIVAQQDSWFLEYGDKAWKDKVHKCLNDMDLIPENIREQFDHTVDWLESWPAIRNYGLGTKLPFDEDFVIEPLSDSTIYMAFYTIRHIIEDIEDDKLKPEFFSYVFNEEGSVEEVSESTGIEVKKIEEARESFGYWYPLDWRTTANELIQNHLTFFMYHHTALFNEENWPNGIATWGMGLLEGEKMSSSKGHVVPAEEAIDEYGADTSRFFLFASVEPWQDFDWRSDEVQQYQDKLESFYERSIEIYGAGEEREPNTLDKYVLSRLQGIIEEATEGLEEFQTRKAGLNAFFELNSLINMYRNRSDNLNVEVVNELVETQVRLMAPFTPHVCEEIWTEIGKEGFVSEADWPEANQEKVDEEVEKAFELVDNTVEDIREVEEFVDSYEKVKIIVAEDWKRELFEELKDVVDERPEFGEAMGRLVSGRKDHADTIKSYLQEYLEEPGELPSEIFSVEREEEILEENRAFIEEEFDAEVEIEREKNSSEDKASRAEPGRPAIVMN
ncbi:MAG: leucine--tRNA ligase [Nanohaloarchaea archaeon]|nr:leucine--tRNA ligase [Candidatus Nanohaloarchaea archaeon]